MAYVPPEYPGEIPDFAEIWPPVDDVNWMYTSAWDALVKEVRAIMAELGVDPAGASADVKTRLGLLALKANVLELDNVTPFTPDADHEPATKKYVDDAGVSFHNPVFTGIVTAPVIDLTGGQIAFPAAQAASADPNTDDDYEEGTWTPVLGGSGGESGQSYAVQDGYYTKKGRVVYCYCRIGMTTEGTITGELQIKGLPFTCAGGNQGNVSVYFGYRNKWTLSAGHILIGITVANSTIVALLEIEHTGDDGANLTAGAVENGAYLDCAFFYMV